MEYFKTFNKDNITISSNKKRITRNKQYGDGSIYGVFVIDNDFNNKTVTKWLFKIHSLDWQSICIGIDSSNNINGCAFDNNGSIGYFDSGNVYKDGKKIESYGRMDGFQKDDIITMIHNPTHKTLTFSRLRGGIIEREKTWYGAQSEKIKQIKGGQVKQYKPIKMNNENKKYKMCVYLDGRQSSVELLSCEQYIDDNQQNDKIQIEEKEQDEDLALAITMSLNEENKRKQKEKAKNDEIASLKQTNHPQKFVSCYTIHITKNKI